MNATEAQARAMNPTQRRLHLLANGWRRGRNDSDWSHPAHDGRFTSAAAVRVALGGGSK